MHARHSHMVVLRGVGVLLVLLLGSILALVQPASAAPALIATEPPRPPDNVQTDHTGVTSDDPPPPDSTPSAAIPDDDATPPPMVPQVQDPASSEPEAASPPSASDAPEAEAPPMATPTLTSTPSAAPSPGPAPAATPPTDSSVVVTMVDPEDDGFSADGGLGIGDGDISAEASAAVATTMAVAIPSAPSIHTLGGLLAYTGAGLGLVLAMVCLLVIGAFALWRSRREETTPAFF